MNDGTRSTGGAVRVGEFVLDPRSGELRNPTGRQVLSAQPLHVLLALVERPGELVTRDELRARLWPSDTFVDFEHGLNAVVKRLRDALGDSAETPRYIETVPRRGYRLLAPVELETPLRKPELASAAAPADPGVRRHRAAAIVAGLSLGLAGAVGLGYALSRWRPADAALEPSAFAASAQPVRLTLGPGLQTDATWSPDGRRIAFAADSYGNFDLFVQGIDGGEPVRLTSTAANETQPAWSPDGERIVFRSDEDGGGLSTIRLSDRAIRRIAGFGFQPAWMPQGRDVVFTGSELQALYVVDAEGSEPPREILKGALSAGAWFSYTVHPDGRIGLLGLHSKSRFGFYVSDRDHRELQLVTGGRPLSESLLLRRAVWTSTGDAVFLEGRASGLLAIWRVAIDPATQIWQTPVQLATGPASADHVAVSPDGKTVAFTSAETISRAWVFPFDADRGTPPGDGRAVTDEDASVAGLQLSTDGKSIFYSEVRPGRDPVPGIQLRIDTGQTTVLYADANGGPVPAPSGSGTSYLIRRTPVGAPNELEYAVAWRSRDGREQLLSRWGPGAFHPSEVRRDDQVVLGAWSPRAYTSNAMLVEWPIGPSAVSEPRRVLLNSEGLSFWQGRYSPNGRWVSFVAQTLDGRGVLQMGVAPSSIRDGSTWSRLAADHPWPDKPRWSPDGRTIYFVSRSASGYLTLWGVRFDPERGVQAGAPFQIKAFDSPRWHIDPELPAMEMGVAKGVLALPMRSVKGSIWLLSSAGT